MNNKTRLTKMGDEKFCFSCAQKLHASARFCPSCGAQQANNANALSVNNSGSQNQITSIVNQGYCGGCGSVIHESAKACPKCGFINKGAPAISNNNTHWTSVVSVIISGFIFLMVLFDDDVPWTANEAKGAVILAFIALILGIVGVSLKDHSKTIAIAGIIVSILAMLGSIGMTVS